MAGKPTYTIQKIKTKPRTEDLREWGDLIRSCVVKKKDEFGQVGTFSGDIYKWIFVF